MQSYLRTQCTYYYIKKSNTSRSFKELKNATLAWSPAWLRDDRLKIMMNLVRTYTIYVRNTKNAMHKLTLQYEHRDTKNSNISFNFRTKRGVNHPQIRCAVICTYNGNTIPSPNQTLFSYTARKNLLPHLKLQKRFWYQICSNTRPLTRYPPNLPIGIDLKTFWVESKQNKKMHNVAFNLALKEVRFLIHFDTPLMALHVAILASNFKSPVLIFFP
jgi:hypothetical protein